MMDESDISDKKRKLELRVKISSNKKSRPSLDKINDLLPIDKKQFDESEEVVDSVVSISAGKLKTLHSNEVSEKLVIAPHELVSKGGSLFAALQKNKELNNASMNSKQLNLEEHATDLTASSLVYESVPVEEFGAALLRGMGWNGTTEESNKQSYTSIQPRKKGLGLGASSDVSVANQRNLGSTHRLQLSDIVQLSHYGRSVRGCIVQASGVPGLNRVRIELENSSEIVDVDKSKLKLVQTSELLENPYARSIGSVVHEDRQKVVDIGDSDSNRITAPKLGSNVLHLSSSSSMPSGNGLSKEKSSERKGWLQPGIRVKIVSKKTVDRSFYLRKGNVLDVPFLGVAAIRCDGSGQIVEIKEKYLETVLPHLGESCLILAGSHRGQSAILREKDSRSGLATIELSDTSELIQIDYDSIAAMTTVD